MSSLPDPVHAGLAGVIDDEVRRVSDDLVALRRDLHAHPELSWEEARTTALLADRLDGLGWSVRRMPRSGLVADLGEGGRDLTVLRADIDALPVAELTEDPWRSTVPGVAHACGHDVHAAALTGAAHALARLHREGSLPGPVRLLLQPAEEVMPGGALHLLENGALDGAARILALHCDPAVDVGRVGLRVGTLTSAADRVEIRVDGSGGHTSRPHLTGDLTHALARLTTELPAVLSRRLDPRAGVSVVFGMVRAGSAANVIPDHGVLAGTVRILDPVGWGECEAMVRSVVPAIVAPYGVSATVDYIRGVPPVVNDAEIVALLADVVSDALGHESVVEAEQSLGGEDFGWYTTHVPGAMLRLGTRGPGWPTHDLHRGDLRVDERAIGLGARLLARAAVRAAEWFGPGGNG